MSGRFSCSERAALGRYALACALLLSACARTSVDLPPAFDAGPSADEICNGLDDDGDEDVDEGFRDDEGRYVGDAHCGRCDAPCSQPIDHASGVRCALIEGAAACVASGCEPGFGPTRGGGCSALDSHLCLPCLADSDCGALESARCASIDGEKRCTRGCAGGCEPGYVCIGGEHCEPEAGSCRCPQEGPPFSIACELAPECIGRAECRQGEQSTCEASAELCGGGDEDCDGATDEGFVDERGAYSLDLMHCGACGRDCTLDDDLELPLTCGGDPFAPSCVLACPDAADGVQVGDMLDADRDAQNGCECRVRALEDRTGEEAGVLDSDCDGADGHILNSFYVAVSGSDENPGSPTRPLATIDEAVQRAAASLDRDGERPDVFVAGGVYTETVHLRDGVRVHGGYRPDYLALDPGGYEVIVIAPAESAVDEVAGGPALVARDVGFRPTMLSGLELRGRDAIDAGGAAIGAAILRPGPNLTLRSVRIRAGRPGAGSSGPDGAAGAAPSSEAGLGQSPRAALENDAHACVDAAVNVTRGGVGGANQCAGTSVRGGNGGSSRCPEFGSGAESGASGAGLATAPGGPGGLGGGHLSGPLVAPSSGCEADVCCGLADFSVPNEGFLPSSGAPGSDGSGGSAGLACSDPFGSFGRGALWQPSTAAGGSSGSPGGGGGGGGAGGGVAMRWFDLVCEHSDGLGGAGGGGGAGGCGGVAGGPGGSGGPSIALLLTLSARNQMPVLEDCELFTERGGRGGDGGNGGDGGPGGAGGFGGRVPDDERTTPPLAGPITGGRGGKGGDGGPGGGGGGGCGGASVGIAVVRSGELAPDLSAWLDDNVFLLAPGGVAGEGGGGPLPAQAGATGEMRAIRVW